MRKTLVALLVVMICMSAVAIAEQHETADAGPWFDMENCDFCRHLLEHDKLLDNMTWEYHKISDGIVGITAVQPEYKDAYMKAQKAMQAVGVDMMTGKVNPKDVKMCNHCKAYGKLMESGAKFDVVHGDAAEVVVITSEKPEVLAMINNYADKTMAGLKEMEATEGHKHDHEGHEH